jgi:hypothetical protein
MSHPVLFTSLSFHYLLKISCRFGTTVCDIATVLLDKTKKENSQHEDSQHYQNSYRLQCLPKENVSHVFMETLNI